MSKNKRWVHKAQFIHKVPCKYCGYYNYPLSLHKIRDNKYYKCVKCGKDLKSDKDEFIDKLSNLLKEEYK